MPATRAAAASAAIAGAIAAPVAAGFYVGAGDDLFWNGLWVALVIAAMVAAGAAGYVVAGRGPEGGGVKPFGRATATVALGYTLFFAISFALVWAAEANLIGAAGAPAVAPNPENVMFTMFYVVAVSIAIGALPALLLMTLLYRRLSRRPVEGAGTP